MNSATRLFNDALENEISNTDLGYEIIERHQKTKKGSYFYDQ